MNTSEAYDLKFLEELNERRAKALRDTAPFQLEKIVCHSSSPSEQFAKVGIFAGIHGDEPAGVKSCRLLQAWVKTSPSELLGYELHLYPACNPDGIKHSRRQSLGGYDLNREFWCRSPLPEVKYLEQQLRAEKYDIIISLHEDDTSHGMYGFVSGDILSENILRPALESASRFIPLNEDAIIDGFEAKDGIIKDGYHGVLCAPPEQRPRALEIVLESPTNESIQQRALATTAAVCSVLSTYKNLISYAQSI